MFDLLETPGSPIHHFSPPAAKITLFRSLFRGRDNIYARRFENRTTGKSGYAPVCQHLNSVDAYRKDRRQDLLLQEHGYIVLRFLTEDVGKTLDQVLDTILRALSSRLR